MVALVVFKRGGQKTGSDENRVLFGWPLGPLFVNPCLDVQLCKLLPLGVLPLLAAVHSGHRCECFEPTFGGNAHQEPDLEVLVLFHDSPSDAETRPKTK